MLVTRHAEARAFENARDQAGPSPLSTIGPSESQLLGPFWRLSLDRDVLSVSVLVDSERERESESKQFADRSDVVWRDDDVDGSVVNAHGGAADVWLDDKRERMRQSSLIIGVVIAAACGRYADAGFIPLDLRNTPDILSGFIDVSYDAPSNELSVVGFALHLDDGHGPGHNIANGSFAITATIDEIGTAVGGALDIGGGVAGFGPSLLTANFIDFGFDPGGGMLLELLFEVTGGDLALEYGGAGALVGVLLNMAGGGYSGDFTRSFDNLIRGIAGTGRGVSDTAPLIPGPAVAALLLLGGLRRRRSRAR